MKDESTTQLEALQKEMEALMATVSSMVPPEFQDAEWVSFFSLKLKECQARDTPESTLLLAWSGTDSR